MSTLDAMENGETSAGHRRFHEGNQGPHKPSVA